MSGQPQPHVCMQPSAASRQESRDAMCGSAGGVRERSQLYRVVRHGLGEQLISIEEASCAVSGSSRFSQRFC